MNDDRYQAEVCVAADHPSLPGHFPGNPVVPGVVLLDRVAAAVEAWCGRHVAALPQVKFLAPLRPEERAELSLERLVSGRLRFRLVRGESHIASGEIELT